MNKDVIGLMAEFLPSSDVLKLRTVCKAWKDAIDKKQWNWDIINEFSDTKYMSFQLGEMSNKKKFFQRYVLVEQLGVFWHPGETYFVLVRDDNCIELKHVLANGSSELVYVTDPQPAPISIVIPLRGGSYLTGDVEGNVAIWHISQSKEMRRFKAHSSKISAALEASPEEIITAAEDGEICCWKLFANDSEKKWTMTEKLPIRKMQIKNKELQIVLEDTEENQFIIKFFSLKNRSVLNQDSVVEFGAMSDMHKLSHLMFFKKRYLIEMRYQELQIKQQIYVCNNKWKDEHQSYQPDTEIFDLKERGQSWVKGYQTYIMSNGNFLFHSVADGSALLGIPKRLPLTNAEEASEPVISRNMSQ